MTSARVPTTTIARLPVYLRCLHEARRGKIDLISSLTLAQMAGSNAAQLRKDLSHLGEFGTRGVGYDVEELICQISKWLGVNKIRSVVIVGFGNLGQALCDYRGFKGKGFEVTGLYDVDKDKIGREVAALHVKNISELDSPGVKAPDIGIIATPASAAQQAAEILVRAGVKAILNFAPTSLEAPRNICVRNVDFSTELQIIGFHISSVEKGLPSSCCEES